MKLNLACGETRWPGFENSDVTGAEGTSYVDLGSFPYPYESESASLVMISHGLFHTRHGVPVIADHLEVLRELHRILRPGGWLRIDDNPARCYRDEENAIDQGSGFPPELRIQRDDFIALVCQAGFGRVFEIPSHETLIPSDEETWQALVGNHLFHASFTIEARK